MSYRHQSILCVYYLTVCGLKTVFMPRGEQRKAIPWGAQRQKLNIIVTIKSEHSEGCKQVMKYGLEMVEGKPFWMSCQGPSHHTKTYTIWKVNRRKIQNSVGTEQSLFKSSTDEKWWVVFIVKQDLESPGRWTTEHAYGEGGENLGYHHRGRKTHLLRVTAFPGWALELYQWRKGLRNSSAIIVLSSSATSCLEGL